MLLSLTAALLITVTAEGVAGLLFSPRLKTALSFALGSLATNPLLNVCYRLSGGSATVLWVGEISAVLLEAWICRCITGVSPRRALALSLALNALSYALGKIIF